MLACRVLSRIQVQLYVLLGVSIYNVCWEWFIFCIYIYEVALIYIDIDIYIEVALIYTDIERDIYI